MLRSLALAVLLASPALASEFPEAPSTITSNRQFKALVVLNLGSVALDAFATRDAISSGCHENNPLFGTHPGNTRLIGGMLAASAAHAGASWWMRRHGGRMGRMWQMPLWSDSAMHFYLGGENLRLNCKRYQQ